MPLRKESSSLWSKPFETSDYDAESFDATRKAVLELAKHAGGFDHAFGAKDEVDPIRHLVGTAAGWGGLPDAEARYKSVEGGPVGEYKLTVRDVPVDGFWSISVYNADGYFEPNDRNAYSVNNLTATRNDDDSVTVHFGGDDDRPNLLPITRGKPRVADRRDVGDAGAAAAAEDVERGKPVAQRDVLVREVGRKVAGVELVQRIELGMAEARRVRAQCR